MPPPYDSVLCPTDLSTVGNLAIAVAYALVASSGTVHLLHVSVPPDAAAPSSAAVSHRDRLVHAALWRLIPDVAAARGVRTEVHTISQGLPADEILIEAGLRSANVIVMSAARVKASDEAHGESIAAAVLRGALVPVILAPTPTQG